MIWCYAYGRRLGLCKGCFFNNCSIFLAPGIKKVKEHEKKNYQEFYMQ